MKTIFYSICFSILSVTSFSQTIDDKIREVFVNDADELVFKNEKQYSFIKDLLTNRIEYVKLNPTIDEKYPLLSNVDLVLKHNQNLTKDLIFNPNTFNPLKYNMEYFSKGTLTYRVDFSNYLIVIHPISLK